MPSPTPTPASSFVQAPRLPSGPLASSSWSPPRLPSLTSTRGGGLSCLAPGPWPRLPVCRTGLTSVSVTGPDPRLAGQSFIPAAKQGGVLMRGAGGRELDRICLH